MVADGFISLNRRDSTTRLSPAFRPLIVFVKNVRGTDVEWPWDLIVTEFVTEIDIVLTLAEH